LLLVLGYANALSANSQTINIGYFVMEPYIYFEQNKSTPKGIIPEFLNEHIAPNMNTKFRYFHMPIARILKKMKTGELDGVAVLGYNKSRATEYAYPANHMEIVKPIFAVLSESDLSREKLTLSGEKLIVGHVKDSMTTSFFLRLETHIDVMHGENVWHRSAKKLLLGRIDALYAPFQAPLDSVLKEFSADSRVKTITIEEDAFRLFTLFSKHEKSIQKDLVRRYDEAFKKIDGEQTYRKVFDKYLDQKSQL